ncbi:MAG: PIG-L family deacetylase [Solobacterium sp.]|nr:PIG-L family deacetylase [Solobacterium sp.]
MSFTKTILKFAAPVPRIESFQRYLFIGPHPDDIEIGAGATIAALKKMGKEIAFVICTDGRYGLDYAPEGTTPQDLIEIRKQEAIASAAVLGVSDVTFLGFSDGGFYDREELVKALAKVIGEKKPEIIFAPDPAVTSECHVDHLNAGMAARQLAFLAPFAEIMKQYGADPAPVNAIAYYMTAKPNRFVRTAPYLDQQSKAIFGCHKSQFPEGCGDISSISLYLKLRAYDFGIRSLKGKAEGFRVLGKTHMHCLPEAGN